MKVSNIARKILITLSAFMLIFIFIPSLADAQYLKTTVSEIQKAQDQFDGKQVQVDGKVQSLNLRTSKRGNDYTTFKLADSTGTSMTVYSRGHLPISNGQSVRVKGRYNKVTHVPPRWTFYNQIDASEGSVEALK